MLEGSPLKSPPNKRSMVIETIAGQIRAGQLTAGERLASVRDLGATFSVSISVIQNALRDLCDNGFIECRGSNGYYVARRPAKAEAAMMEASPSAGQVFLLLEHHSDLLWRHDLAGYRAIRDEQLTRLFDLARRHRNCAFVLEQAHIAEVFFADHPERLAEARELVREQRLDLCGAYTIPDLNLICGESIIRNLEIGRTIYRELFAADPDYVRMTDAFGMCAQLPQILLHCNQKTLFPGRLPNTPREIRNAQFFRWHSLAGPESVLVFQPSGAVTHLGYSVNVPLLQDYESRLSKGVQSCLDLSGDCLVTYGTEETPLRESIFALVAQANCTGRKPLVFSSGRKYLAHFSAEDAGFLDYTGECNPTFTGCYTTRIGIKQRIRQAESRLLLAETLDVLRGEYTDRTVQWKALCMAQFHDAACGCHSDAAFADVDRALQTATPDLPALSGAGVTVVSHSGVGGLQPVLSEQPPAGVAAQQDLDGRVCFLADLPQCGSRHFTVSENPPPQGADAPPSFENQWLQADFTEIFPRIIAKDLPHNPFGQDGFGEIRFRHDTGSMWSEEFWTLPRGREYQREKLLLSQDGPVFHLFVTEGEVLPGPPEDGNTGPHWPGFGSLSFRKEYRFYHQLDYFTLRLTLHWQGANTKVSIRFPTALKPNIAVATCETPFAAAVRKPYFEVREEFAAAFQPLAEDADYAQAKGDWPALNWTRLADYDAALTVANTGTPGHQVANGAIEVSLLRSPTKIADGGLAPPQGALDVGNHVYEFAFRAHSPLEEGASPRLGFLLNRPPAVLPGALPDQELLSWRAPNLALSALRPLSGGQILARIYETDGSEAPLELGGEIPRGHAQTVADAFGQEMPGAAFPHSLKPMEIKTFVFTNSEQKRGPLS